MRQPFRSYLLPAFLSAVTLGGASLLAADWPHWGGDASRNMVSRETEVPVEVEIGDPPATVEDLDKSKAPNIKWLAKLGNQTYGNPTVAGGRVYVGTNKGTVHAFGFLDERR